MLCRDRSLNKSVSQLIPGSGQLFLARTGAFNALPPNTINILLAHVAKGIVAGFFK